jgi:hypothetical protein
MITEEIDRLRQLVESLAETYDRRKPTETAIKNWFVTLHQFSWVKVEQALQQWMTSKPRMPAPAEIRAVLDEQAMAKRAAEWQAAKEQERKDIANLGATETGLKTLDAIKGMLGKRPRPPTLSPALQKMIAQVAAHYRCPPGELREMERLAAANPQEAETCYAALMREVSEAQQSQVEK